MRIDIARRLNRLEQEAGIGAQAQPPPLIVVSFVRPNGQGGEPCQSDRAECIGQVWHRKPGEASQDFETRVMASLQRSERFPTVVIFFPTCEPPRDRPRGCADRHLLYCRDLIPKALSPLWAEATLIRTKAITTEPSPITTRRSNSTPRVLSPSGPGRH